MTPSLDLQSEGKNSSLTWFFLEMACCSTWCLLLPRQSGIRWKCVRLQFWLTGGTLFEKAPESACEYKSHPMHYSTAPISLGRVAHAFPCLSWRQRAQKTAQLVPCQSWPGRIGVQQETTRPMATFHIPAPWASKYARSWWGGIILQDSLLSYNSCFNWGHYASRTWAFARPTHQKCWNGSHLNGSSLYHRTQALL